MTDKTNPTIQNLANDLTPWSPMDSVIKFGVKWFAVSFMIFGLCAYFMPWRTDLSHLSSYIFRFHTENILWILAAVFSALALYESAFPQPSEKKYGPISIALICILFIFSFIGPNHELAEQWMPEMSLWRGRCGFIITAFAVLETPFLAFWAKRGAPYNSGHPGLWAAMTSASLGCLLMQVICEHHNSLHLLLWHFLPLTMVCGAGYAVTKKFLRW